MQTKTYHGMTLEEIKFKYYIDMTGAENYAHFNIKNAKLSRLWQDANHYYTDTVTQITAINEKLRQLDEETELRQANTKVKYIIENKSLPIKERYSDGAREALSIVETKTENFLNNLKIIREQLMSLNEELAVWHEVKETLKFISERINNSSMNLASESKFLKREPSNTDASRDPVSGQDFDTRRDEKTIREQDDIPPAAIVGSGSGKTELF